MVEHKKIEDLEPMQRQLLIYAFFKDLYAKIKNPAEKKKIEDFLNYCFQKEDSCLCDLISDIKDNKKAITSVTINMDESTNNEEKVRDYTRLFETTIFRSCGVKLTLRTKGISLIRKETFSFSDSRFYPKVVKRDGFIKQGLFYRVSGDDGLSVWSIEQSKKYDAIFKEDMITKQIWRREYTSGGVEIKNGGTVDYTYVNPYLNSSYKYMTYRGNGYIVRLIWHIHNEIKDNKTIKHEPQLTSGTIHRIEDGEVIESLDNVSFEKDMDIELVGLYTNGLMAESEIYEIAHPLTSEETRKSQTKYNKYAPSIMR